MELQGQLTIPGAASGPRALQAHRPGLSDLHHRQRGTHQRHVFCEVDHLVHPLAGIVDLPESMHLESDRNEKCDKRRQPLARLHTRQNAQSAGQKKRPGGRNRQLCLRYTFACRVSTHLLLFNEMMKTAVDEVAAEDRPPEHEDLAH